MAASDNIIISPRLLDDARKARDANERNKTVEPVSGPRKLALPPDCTEERFHVAVKALRLLIGVENVDVVDQPLDDGWYLNHPKT